MNAALRSSRSGLAVLLVSVLLGCATADSASDTGVDPDAMRARDDFTPCSERRPEICTQEYVPVCALSRTERDCVTAPCEAIFERVTKANRCTACADPTVLGWIPGACDADPVDSPLYLDP